MSIQDVIKARCDEERLFALEPQIRSARVVRAMFVSKEIYDAVSAPADVRFGVLRGQLDTFTIGGKLTVAENPFEKEKTCFIARADPTRDEVWQIRSIDPRPAIRVFGHFAERDYFVALTWRFRKELGEAGSKAWRDEIERCKAEWRKLFHPYKPHRGTNVAEYISKNFRLA